MKQQSRCHSKNRGVALITVLLIIAIATVLAVSLASRQHLLTRKTQNILYSEQTWTYVLGIENWALAVLDEDDPQIDTPKDSWNHGIPVTHVNGGKLRAEIVDLQSRFNLNNLVSNGEVNLPDKQRFERLLIVLGLDPAISNRVIDWIDKDSDPRHPSGAEDNIYINRSQAYRAANAPFSDISELLLVEGIDRKTFDRLKPHVTSLPQYAALNVNTIDSTLIRVLAENLSTGEAKQLIADRKQQPISDIEQWLLHPIFAGKEISEDGLDTASHYFLVKGAVEVGQRPLEHESVIHRQDKLNSIIIGRKKTGVFDG